MLYITVIKLKLGNCSFLLFSCLNIISQIYDPYVAHIWTYAAHLKLFGKVVGVAAASSTTWIRTGPGVVQVVKQVVFGILRPWAIFIGINGAPPLMLYPDFLLKDLWLYQL